MGQRPDSERPRAFFEAPESPEPLRGRLLLISFYFPPAPASGSLRWQKLSQFAAERGWALDAITLHPRCLQSQDPDRLRDLACGTRVYGVAAPTLLIDQVVRGGWRLFSGMKSLLRTAFAAVTALDAATGSNVPINRPDSIGRDEVRWALPSPRWFIRAYSAWLDHASSGRWAHNAAALAERLIEPGLHEAIITSGPPHMVHDAGRQLSRKTGLPLIMDMRDPWSLAERLHEHLASPAWLLLASRYERRAIAQSALVVTNTEPFRLAMCRIYPEASDRVITAMNGTDEGPVPASRHGDRFIIAYAGAIYIDRDPRILFRAAARIIDEFALTPADLGIELIGNVDQYERVPISQIAREEGLSGFVRTGPVRPHREALEFLAQASMLVSLPQDNDLAIPAKIFEYARFDAWVLALATQESATGLALAGSGADIVAPNDLDGIVSVLRERFLQHRRGIRPTCLARNGRFSRRAQADILLDAIARRTRRDGARTKTAALMA